MALYSRFLLVVATLFMLTTLGLAFKLEERLDVYYSLYIIEYLAVAVVFAALNVRARRGLSLLGYLLVPGALVAAIVEVIRLYEAL